MPIFAKPCQFQLKTRLHKLYYDDVYVIFTTHLHVAVTKCLNVHAPVWIEVVKMHEVKLTVLCYREPIQVYHAFKRVVTAKCVPWLLYLPGYKLQ